MLLTVIKVLVSTEEEEMKRSQFGVLSSSLFFLFFSIPVMVNDQLTESVITCQIHYHCSLINSRFNP